jgi:hypothetical protein
MATAGTTSQPNSSTVAYGLNVQNQFGTSVTMPAGGPWLITAAGCWFAGWNENARYQVCVWDLSTEALLGSSAQGTVAVKTMQLGNATSVQQNMSTPFVVNGGEVLLVGFHTHSDDGRWLPIGSGGTRRQRVVGDSPGSMVGSAAVAGNFNGWVIYSAANALPTAPTLTAPANAARFIDTTPLLDWTHNDPDGDAQTARQVQVSTDSDFSSVTHWNSTATTSTQSATYAGTALSRGVTYYWRVRTSDAAGYGPFSSARTFKINQLPTVTKTSPVTNGAATIHNFANDLNIWTLAGAHAKPSFAWTFSDPDGDAQNAYQVRIYSASSGGSTLYDSGQVASSTKAHDATWAGVLGTTYYWTLAVRDSLNEWSAESSRTAFVIRWGQAIYEYAVAGGAASSAWSFSAAAASGGSVAFLYASATGAAGAGRSAWKTSVATLTPSAYLNVLVRLRPATAGTNVTLPSMTFSYLAAAQQPDKWQFQSPNGLDWRVDPEVRRFGSRALRCTLSTASPRYAFPYENGVDSDVSVSPNTEYTLSTYVNTGAAPVNSDISLHVYAAGDILTPLEGLYLDDSESRTRDTWVLDPQGRPVHSEGWQRLWLRFRTQEQDHIRPMIHYGDADLGPTVPTVGDQFWIDAAQLEESAMPTPWRPGMVGQPVVLDVGGIIVDKVAGGIFRLRGSDGTARDVVELGAKGLLFGGDAEVFSDGPGSIGVPTVARALFKGNAISIPASLWTPITAWQTTPLLANGVSYNGLGGSELRADVAGVYLIWGKVTWAGQTGGDRRVLGVSIANNAIVSSPAAPGRSTDFMESTVIKMTAVHSINHMTIGYARLAVNDCVRLMAHQNHTAAINIDRAEFGIFRLGT